MMTRPSNSPVVPLRWREDFGAVPEEPIEPPPMEPAFSAADIAEAREAGWNDGYIAACRAHLHAISEETHHAMDELLRQADAMDHRLEIMAERNATAVAAWLGELFLAALPEMETHIMESRIALAARQLNGMLRDTTQLTVRAADQVVAECASLRDAWRTIAAWRAEHADDTPITIDWDSGQLRIDPRQSWRDIAALQPFLAAPPPARERVFNVAEPVGAFDVG